MGFDARDRAFMADALDEARAALRRGEVPVGCALVRRGVVIARAHNDTVATRNATRHCEVVAVEAVQRAGAYGRDVFRECTLYVTVEPCIMCASLLAQVGIGRVVFGCHNERFGGNGSVYALHQGAYESTPGLCRQAAVDLLKQFYESGNPSAPVTKRARTLAADG
ncbi:tRNA(adenine(34)) deaminase [Plasmodiophora brassicae]|uniref:CMP/dCMP-type deaminase domain-containing protein n=1 Tax=Plasmodiophora brassicae TaxID=37360 RepID=A0A0G4IXJ6_PLABS|nr:hypothetical protein PBRA_007500 [Plasmodiophora brassicae]SPQ97072.1 unnamed protein product [Plasmodiophora brassicae]